MTTGDNANHDYSGLEDTAGRPIQDFWVNTDRLQLVLPFFKSSNSYMVGK